MADHILEIAGSGLFCDYFSNQNIAKIKLHIINAANFLKLKDDFDVINQFILFRLI